MLKRITRAVSIKLLKILLYFIHIECINICTELDTYLLIVCRIYLRNPYYPCDMCKFVDTTLASLCKHKEPVKTPPAEDEAETEEYAAATAEYAATASTLLSTAIEPQPIQITPTALAERSAVLPPRPPRRNPLFITSRKAGSVEPERATPPPQVGLLTGIPVNADGTPFPVLPAISYRYSATSAATKAWKCNFLPF